MKIGILTYYGVHNHGAVLQANALKMVLESKGHECGFLKFERSYSNISQKQASKYKIGINSIGFYLRYLMDKGPGNVLYNLKKKKTLARFRSDKLPIFGEYQDFNGDLVVIGSDEVFSLEIGINPFLYGNGLKSKHVFSYAGCFGPTTYHEVVRQSKTDIIARGLKKMEAVSVRDENSWRIVKKTANIDSTLVCDPVILYGYEKEMNQFIPSIKEYILIYAYDKNMNDPSEYGYIKKYAEKHSFKVVSVGYYHKWCKNINASPEELLGWIKHASMVVTDTFHGTVMSIICNTPVVVKLRGNQNKLEFLLSEYGLLNRAIEDFSALEKIVDVPEDFTYINQVISERRVASMEFIEDALEKCQ